MPNFGDYTNHYVPLGSILKYLSRKNPQFFMSKKPTPYRNHPHFTKYFEAWVRHSDSIQSGYFLVTPEIISPTYFPTLYMTVQQLLTCLLVTDKNYSKITERSKYYENDHPQNLKSLKLFQMAIDSFFFFFFFLKKHPSKSASLSISNLSFISRRTKVVMKKKC